MIRFFSFAIGLTFCSIAFGQKITSTNVGNPKVLYNEGGVVISSQLVTCNDASRHEIMNFELLSIQNSNDSPVAIKMKEDIYYDGACRTCDNYEYNFTLNLEAKELKSGSCNRDGHPALSIFSSMNDGYIKEKLTDTKLQVVRLH